MQQTKIKILAGAGSLILLAVAILHLMGLDSVRSVASNVEDDFMAHTIITLWALLSFHLIFISLLAFGASFYKSKACAAFLIGFGVWILLDAIIIWTHVGMFEAVPMLLSAGGLYLLAGLLLRRLARAK